jgi:hypothetical protein
MLIITKDPPKLFKKFSPKEYRDHQRDKNGDLYSECKPWELSEWYDFKFMIVEVQSHHIDEPFHQIDAMQINLDQDKPSLEDIFNQDMLDIFEYGQEFVQEKVDQHISIIPELKYVKISNIKYSKFQRCLPFFVNIDSTLFKKGYKDLESINQTAAEIYYTIEYSLIKQYGLKESIIKPENFMGISEMDHNTKDLMLSNDISVHIKCQTDLISAGQIGLYIYCNEKGKIENFRNVQKHILNQIDQYKKKFVSYSGSPINYGLKGLGTTWEIDLSNLKLSKKLEDFSTVKLLC